MNWLSDLVRDLLWARARVMILGGWHTRPAWRFVRYAARHGGPPIASDMYAMISRGHYYRVWRSYCASKHSDAR